MGRTTMDVEKARDAFLRKRVHLQSARRDEGTGDLLDVHHDRFIVTDVRGDHGKIELEGRTGGTSYYVTLTQGQARTLAAAGDICVDNARHPFRVTILTENDFW